MWFRKENSLISCLACCNSEGTKHLLLMIISNAHKPYEFSRKTRQELGSDCDSNKKAWMTRQLFSASLVRLISYLKRTLAPKILLLVDNCSTHGKKDALSRLDNL